MAFVYKGSLRPNGDRVLKEFTLKSAETFTVGQALKFAAGVLTSGTPAPVAGILVSIRKADGSPVTDNGAGADFTSTYLTPASNTVVGVMDISRESLYSVVADATIGSTNDSDLPGGAVDLLALGLQVNESTAVAAGSPANFFSFGADPDGDAPTNSVLVCIQESQISNI